MSSSREKVVRGEERRWGGKERGKGRRRSQERGDTEGISRVEKKERN